MQDYRTQSYLNIAKKNNKTSSEQTSSTNNTSSSSKNIQSTPSSGSYFETTDGKIGYASSSVTQIKTGGKNQPGNIIYSSSNPNRNNTVIDAEATNKSMASQGVNNSKELLQKLPGSKYYQDPMMVNTMTKAPKTDWLNRQVDTWETKREIAQASQKPEAFLYGGLALAGGGVQGVRNLLTGQFNIMFRPLETAKNTNTQIKGFVSNPFAATYGFGSMLGSKPASTFGNIASTVAVGYGSGRLINKALAPSVRLGEYTVGEGVQKGLSTGETIEVNKISGSLKTANIFGNQKTFDIVGGSTGRTNPISDNLFGRKALYQFDVGQKGKVIASGTGRYAGLGVIDDSKIIESGLYRGVNTIKGKESIVRLERGSITRNINPIGSEFGKYETITADLSYGKIMKNANPKSVGFGITTEKFKVETTTGTSTNYGFESINFGGKANLKDIGNAYKDFNKFDVYKASNLGLKNFKPSTSTGTDSLAGYGGGGGLSVTSNMVIQQSKGIVSSVALQEQGVQLGRIGSLSGGSLGLFNIQKQQSDVKVVNNKPLSGQINRLSFTQAAGSISVSKVVPISITKPISSQIPMTDVYTVSRIKPIVSQIPMQSSLQTTKSIQAFNVPSFNSFPVTPFVPSTSLFFPSMFNGDMTSNKSFGFGGGKRATKYTPSFGALFFKQYGSYKKGKLSKSGLDYRPITPGFSFGGKVSVKNYGWNAL